MALQDAITSDLFSSANRRSGGSTMREDSFISSHCLNHISLHLCTVLPISPAPSNSLTGASLACSSICSNGGCLALNNAFSTYSSARLIFHDIKASSLINESFLVTLGYT